VPPIGTPESINVTGAERTTFFPVVERTSKAFGFDIQPDPETRGRTLLPLGSLQSGARRRARIFRQYGPEVRRHPPEWGKAQRDEYTAKHYHQPSDEYRADMDFASNAALAKFGFALGCRH